MSEQLKLRDIFGVGNGKLGETLNFSLPAVVTCPGATITCKSRCYALNGRYRTHVVQNALTRNHQTSMRPDFHKQVVGLLCNLSPKYPRRVRWHPAGDIYSPTYARKLLYVMKRVPDITFWLYTRSWRIPEIRKVLNQMAKLPNCHLWFSCDQDTGSPGKLPKKVRLAYMMVRSEDVPVYEPDLYFRDYPVRKVVMKHVNGTMVCPAENGVSHVSCDHCKLCLSDPELDPARRTRGRFSLDIVKVSA